MTTDTREIWICGDIDQVERGRGEDLVLERDLASVESRRSQLPLSFKGGGASFTSSLDNCEQREFLYLPLTFQAADSAEIVSLGDDYPNKRSFKPLPAAEAVLH